MFQGAWMIHKRDQSIGHRRVSGIAGLGGDTQVGEPQSRSDDVYYRLPVSRLGAKAARVKPQSEINQSQGRQNQQQNFTRSHQTAY
jgi:hypothetical protein